LCTVPGVRPGKKAVVDVQKATLIGRNVISRIENGELEKIRFSDILKLDKYYQAEEFLQSVF
jgi:hypothetical protein